MFGKKRLASKMIQGVDIVKLVLYKILIDDFSYKYKEKEEKFYKFFASSLINEIFGCHNSETQELFNNNEEIAVKEIKEIGINHPELKKPITDALRVFIQANQMLDSKTMKNNDYVMDLYKRAIERGIFIKEGESPSPDTFLKMTEELSNKYNITE